MLRRAARGETLKRWLQPPQQVIWAFRATIFVIDQKNRKVVQLPASINHIEKSINPNNPKGLPAPELLKQKLLPNNLKQKLLPNYQR